MTSDTIHFPREDAFQQWVSEFLKKELAPYPGRGSLVARMVISATLTAILLVTFRIPGGVSGVLAAFLLSRENLLSTARSAIIMVLAFLIGALFIPVGARLLASTPEMHFVWIGGSIFLAFFLLRCLADYGVATGLALVVSSVVGIWYLPGPAERNVELTLWVVGGTVIGAIVTLCVEIVFHAIRGGDDLIDGLDSRLALIEELMASYSEARPVSSAVQAGLATFASVGVGVLRRLLARASHPQLYRARMSAVVSLVARSVDFAAALAVAYPSLPAELQDRPLRLRRNLADIRNCLRIHGQPCEPPLQRGPDAGTPLLSEIEAMLSLIHSIFSTEAAIDPELEPLEDPSDAFRIFVPDAFSNPEHLRYVLGGTFAAMLCYVFYVALDWPGLTSSVTTCILTGLTTIGSSRQKQILRVTGSILGGVVAGLGTQIFIIPHIDSIGGFTVLFGLITTVAAWIATSSSRLSYAGVQFAFAFYLIHLSDFSVQTNLAIGRDRVLGVLFGSTMMWLVFERLFRRSAADEMVRIFIVNLRLLADLLSRSPRADDPASVLRLRRQRDEIYRRFGEVTAQADAIPFETGPWRANAMAARGRIRRWQTMLRSFYLLQAPLLQFRVFSLQGAKSRSFTTLEDDFRSECSHVFLRIAASIENQLWTRKHREDTVESLRERIDATPARMKEEFSDRERALWSLARKIAELVDRLQDEVAAEGLYNIPPTRAELRPLLKVERA
jgi:multidrug resistance protein MdtO